MIIWLFSDTFLCPPTHANTTTIQSCHYPVTHARAVHITVHRRNSNKKNIGIEESKMFESSLYNIWFMSIIMICVYLCLNDIWFYNNIFGLNQICYGYELSYALMDPQ